MSFQHFDFLHKTAIFDVYSDILRALKSQTPTKKKLFHVSIVLQFYTNQAKWKKIKLWMT